MLDHYLTYQHSVQKFFVEHIDRYDGIVIPLSIISAFSGGTNGFIRALCAKDRRKRYGIDPRTALFQRQWNREKHVRDPHRRIAAILGKPFSDVGLERPVVVEDFPDELVRESAMKCIQYQLEFRHTDDERKVKKYAKLLEMDEICELGVPQYLIPPYFMSSGMADSWFDLGRKFWNASNEFADGVPVWPVIHISKAVDLLPADQLVKIFHDDSISDIWLFPNDFREHSAPASELEALLNAVKTLSVADIHPRMLHGGYFSVMLSKFGLKGFANGVGYGEWKDSGYHRGGAADLRIYCLPLHRFIGVAQAEFLIELDPAHFASDGLLFERVYREGSSFLEVSFTEANEHFMRCREEEINFVSQNDLRKIVSQLRDASDALQAAAEDQIRGYSQSLLNWADVLAE